MVISEGGFFLKVMQLEDLLINDYNDTYDHIYRYVISKCRNINDANDLIQNIYLNYYKRLKSKGPVDDPKSYLTKIARNELNKHYGLLNIIKNHIPVFSICNDEDFSSFEADLHKNINVDDTILCDEIWSYLEKGDVLILKIFTLYFISDLKIKDISKTLNISESTVKNKLYRTMKQINNIFNLD